MDSVEFLESAKIASKFIVDYWKTSADKNVVSSVEPGYLSKLMDESCPEGGVDFGHIFREFQSQIVPGLTNWTSPHFHGYFPAGNCFESMIGELLCAGLNTVSPNWEACPAATDLEVVVLDWIAKMMDLPEHFLNSSEGPGGSVLQGTSTESALLSLISARKICVQRMKSIKPELSEQEIETRLCFYASQESHSFVERIGVISATKVRFLPYDQEGKLSPYTLKAAIEEDTYKGLIPCFAIATLGSTTTCSHDNLAEIGPICQENNIWLHVDAAYAGSALVCPEFRSIANGLEYADSFAVGLHKWFLMSFDVVAYWLKNANHLIEALTVSRIYLKHKREGASPDYMHWQIGTGRKFKALKIWMVLRSRGVKGMREHIRRHVRLGQYFESMLKQDDRFQLVRSKFGLVAFHLKVGNKETEQLRNRVLEKGKIYLTPCHFHGKYLIRFVVNFSTRQEDVEFAWREIQRTATDLEKSDNKKNSIDMLDVEKILHIENMQPCNYILEKKLIN